MEEQDLNVGFTANDRKTLTTVEILLGVITKQLDDTVGKVSRLEEVKANHREVVELERKLLSELDGFKKDFTKQNESLSSTISTSFAEGKLASDRFEARMELRLKAQEDDTARLKVWRAQVTAWATSAGLGASILYHAATIFIEWVKHGPK